MTATRLLAIQDAPSPNQEDRPQGTVIDMLILHYTGMETGAAALERLCDPDAKVSAHYLVETDGHIKRLVPEAKRAWHAGIAAWAGATNINDRSIGIELVNPGHEFGYTIFPEQQMSALIALCEEIRARHPIPSHHVLGHSDVAPARKKDPGELFDWPRLARHGLGIWPEPTSPAIGFPAITWLQRTLATVGYDITQTGILDGQTAEVVTAFQRHYQPDNVSGTPDRETAARLISLHRTLDAQGRLP